MGYQLYVAGARGSRTVCGKDFLHFGGDTSCYVITNGTYALVIDAGSGLSNATHLLQGCKKIDVVLTHIHYDHIVGLLDFDAFPKGVIPCLHGTFAEWGVDETQRNFVRKPYWPVPMRRNRLKQTQWDVCYAFGIGAPPLPDVEQEEGAAQAVMPTQPTTQPEQMQQDWLHVTFRASNHPDVCSSVQVAVGHKNILFLCDYEHGQPMQPDMMRPYDIMFYDGMFTEEEYPSRRGYGHSTITQGIALAKDLGVKQLVLTHHNPNRTDAALAALEAKAKTHFDGVAMAYTGMTILL